MYYQIWHYLKYLLKAKGARYLHSPFIFDFYKQVLSAPKSAVGERIEALRQSLKHSETKLSFRDLGAGYGGDGIRMKTKTIGQIVHSSAMPRKYGELLHALCRYYQPKTCIELGTNLGFSGLYQFSALDQSTCMTIEGAEPLTDIANKHFHQFGLNPEVVVGEFGQVLADMQIPQLDYVYIDGNHTYDASILYFQKLLPYMRQASILVMDDIYWSSDMQQAWREIAANPAVSISIDVYHFGIAFLHRPQAKEHFVLRY